MQMTHQIFNLIFCLRVRLYAMNFAAPFLLNANGELTHLPEDVWFFIPLDDGIDTVAVEYLNAAHPFKFSSA